MNNGAPKDKLSPQQVAQSIDEMMEASSLDIPGQITALAMVSAVAQFKFASMVCKPVMPPVLTGEEAGKIIQVPRGDIR